MSTPSQHTFESLGLNEPLRAALAEQGYTTPTPIQVQAIPPLLAGRDLLAVAQTGTGKTAAFALPLLQRLALAPASDRPGVLILAPTRELAVQLCERITAYAAPLPLRAYALYGGVELGPQVTALAEGVQVLVATPGRLLHLHREGALDLGGIQALVLDEADRMLDMGFRDELHASLRLLPEGAQTALLSATMPEAVKQLADQLLKSPARVSLIPEATPLHLIEQRVVFVRSSDKRALLSHLLREMALDRALVFLRTREGAERMATLLIEEGLSVAMLHGERSQSDRTEALDGFREGRVRVLVATDLAARGIDVVGVGCVFNVELPREAEDYIHRVGRTGRAGREGLAISFCDETEGGRLRDLERALGAPLAPDLSVPFTWHDAIPGSKESGRKRGGRRGKRR